MDMKLEADEREAANRPFMLRTWDKFLYLCGVIARVQTIIVGTILFFVETSNECVVPVGGTEPIPRDKLPRDITTLPGSEFVVMSITI